MGILHTPEPALKYTPKASPQWAPTLTVGASLLAKNVNDNAGILDKSVACAFFASKLAPTVKRLKQRAFCGLLQQQRRWREALPVLLGQVAGAGDEVVQPVLVDKLQRATTPSGKTDAED